MTSIIATIQELLVDANRRGMSAKKGKESLKWLAKKSRSLKVTQKDVLNTTKDRMKETTQLSIGKLYFFTYDPKTKDKLPYYDRFPCVFIFNITPKLIYGINMHYLPYKERAILMDELYKVETNARIPNNKKLQLSWEILKTFTNFPLVKPCVKSYLPAHFRSRLINVPYEEWGISVFLPVTAFTKKNTNEVWQESKKIINKSR